MASVEEAPSSGRKGPGVKKAKKLSTRIDMTPFVDVLLLLIIFFVFTTTMSAPTTMDLNMPKDSDKKDETKIKESGALNIFLGKDNALFYYEGMLDETASNFKSASFTEIRDIIIKKKRDVMSQYVTDPECEAKAKAEKKSIDDACKQKDFFVVIKPTDEATYKNVVDILDEMTINKVARYALMKPYPTELELVKASEGAAPAAGTAPAAAPPAK